MREDETFGTERAANLWLTFWISAFLSALGLYLVLNFAVPSGMALLIAIPAGAVIGGMLSRVRAVRRWVAYIIQIVACLGGERTRRYRRHIGPIASSLPSLHRIEVIRRSNRDDQALRPDRRDRRFHARRLRRVEPNGAILGLSPRVEIASPKGATRTSIKMQNAQG